MTRFFSCPLPFPGMISTEDALMRIASSMTLRIALSMSAPLLKMSWRSSVSFEIAAPYDRGIFALEMLRPGYADGIAGMRATASFKAAISASS